MNITLELGKSDVMFASRVVNASYRDKPAIQTAR